MVVANWRTRLAPEVFTLPRLGTLNVHDALLPAYAGFAPLNWALINGETEVGVTAHMMNDELDAGDIVRQEAVPVGPKDTATDLFFDGTRLTELPGERHPDGAAHGSGCTHSSTLAARLALGDEPLAAARHARRVAAQAVADGLRDLGAGVGPVDVFGLARGR